MRRVGAGDAAAPGVAAGKRVEVEPGLGAGMTDRLEAATATRTRNRGQATITNRENGADAGIGRVEHLRSRLSGDVGSGGKLGRRYSPPL